MAISSPGIGSNLDVNSIVSQLIAVDKKPISKLDLKTTSFQAKLSGFGTLKGVLSQFQSTLQGLSDLSRFQGVKTAVTDATIASANGLPTATPGNYSLEVSKLAQSQKLNAAGQASSSTAIGSGATTTLTFDLGTISGGSFNAASGTYTGSSFESNGAGVKTVTIDSSNNSLAGIRDAINKAGAGVTATIVNDGSNFPYRLSLSVAAPGKNNSLKLSVTDGDGPAGALSALLANDPSPGGTQSLKQTAAAQNAEFSVDGITVSKPTNTISDAIPGVTLNLIKTNVGAPTAVTVARDTSAITGSVNAFVKSFNDTITTLKNASAYNAATGQAAVLNGEASIRSIQNQIRGVLTSPVAGGASTLTLLSQVGVTVQKDGNLGIDNTKLQASIDTNFDQIAGLFSAVGKGTDALAAFSSASVKTKPGAYDLVVTRLASQGTTTASAAANLTITAGVNDVVDVQLDGKSTSLILKPGTYTNAAALASELQSKINGAAVFAPVGAKVTVTESGGIISLKSNLSGSASSILITGGTAEADLQFGAGASTSAGQDVVGTIGGVAAVGVGQNLTGAAGMPSEGLIVSISGGLLGNRGTINYSKGYAAQLNTLTTALLAADGPIASRTNGLNTSIKDLAKTKDELNARLADTEKRYRAQFTALDSVISKMSTTSTFLTQQLANLSKST